MQKYESKLHNIVKILLTQLDSLDAEIMVTRNRNLETVRELVQETSPGQNRRGEAIFWGRGHSTFFGEHVSRRFPKVGSREWVFLEK